MMVVRKLFVIPEEFYTSLMKRQKILDDPLLGEQIHLEEQKEAILRKPKNVDEKAAELAEVAHKERTLDVQRKANETRTNIDQPPPPVISATTAAVASPRHKKAGRPAKNKVKYFDLQIGSGKSKTYAYLIENFYMYEPNGKSMKQLSKLS